MIDPVVQVVICEFVSNSGKMDNGIAFAEQWLPVERDGKVRKRDRDNVRIFESEGSPACGDHLKAPRDQVRHKMPASEAAGTRHEHIGLITH